MKSFNVQFLILALFITISLGIASAAILLSEKNDFAEKNTSSEFESQIISQKTQLASDISRTAEKNIEKVEIESAVFNVELADTAELRTQGLSGRKKLDQNSGLLFVFEELDDYGFWMKDMNFPIDIIWIDENNFVAHIEKNIKPNTFPKIFYPNSKALFVLEVNAGLVSKYQIELGSKVNFLPDNCLLACV